MLHTLQIIDKHRRPNLVLTAVNGAPFPQFPTETGFRLVHNPEPIESGAEVYRWLFSVRPAPDVLAEQMRVNAYVLLGDAIDEGPDLGGPLLPLLQFVYNRALATIAMFAGDFPPAELPDRLP